MRAILRCSTKVENEELDSLLASLNWWPNLEQDDPILQERSDDIMNHIAQEDRDLAKKTLLYTVYDDTTKTWGIVSRPSTHMLTFRLKNPVSERLKAACEKLIADLQPVRAERGRAKTEAFAFSARIEVLEPNSQDHAFSGEILPPMRFLLAVRERKTEAYVGAFTACIAILLATLTSPPVKAALLPSLTGEWQQWVSGNLERFTTAALVTMVISWFEVMLHWFDMRRKSYIRWILE